MDDPKIMMREVPNRATQMLGARIGQVMPTGSGTNLVLEPYRGGAQFAGEYVQQSLCPSATMMRGGPIPAQTQALNAQFAPIAQAEGKTLHVDAGDVSFKCGSEIGYAYAITVQAFQPGGQVSIWAVYRIAGYLPCRGRRIGCCSRQSCAGYIPNEPDMAAELCQRMQRYRRQCDP